MIKNVSSTFKANCKKDSVKYREYIIIDNKEVDIKGNLTDTAYKDTTFFGKFNLKMLKFETENDIDYKKKEFTYYKEVDGEALKIGTFIVTEVKDSDTFESVNVTAYDYGLKFANPYTTNLDYKNGNITMLQVVQEICNKCDIELENTYLPNGSFIVDSNQFVNGEKYGDVICIVALENGMFATINSNNKLEFIFTNETDEIIEDYVELDDKRDTQPITSVLVAPSKDLETAGAVMKDQTLINQYGEHWLKIYDSYFANSTTKCQQLISAIFNQVKGFSYSSFKSEYSFLPYLTLGDKIKFKNKEGKLVDSIILRYETNYDEMVLEAPSIINASIEYELPETPEEISKKALIKVDQANGEIELIAKATEGLNSKTAQLRLDVDKIEGQISDIADITTTVEGTGTLVVGNVNESEPIYIKIYPKLGDIKSLYPADDLYPSDTLYPNGKTLHFHCTSEVHDVDYELPRDLLWFSNDVYDEFILDYDNNACYVIQRVGVDSDGNKYALANSIQINYEYPTINLIGGDYEISLIGHPNAYIYIRLMVQNIYTDQFATKVEMNSKITQTANEINLEVSKKVGNDEVISKINQTSETITIQASKVNIGGVMTAINNNTTTTIDGNKITTGSITTNQIKSGAITADKVSSDVITTNNFSAQEINADKITAGTLSAASISLKNSTLSPSSSKIGGWNVGASYLYNGGLNGNNGARLYADGRLYMKSNYGWINSGNSGTFVLGNGTYKAVLGDAFSFGTDADIAGDSSSTVALRARYGNIRLAANVGSNGIIMSTGTGGISLNGSTIHSGSSRLMKRNIKLLNQKQLDEIYTEVEKMPLYKYDYKKDFYNGDKNNYGFVIEDIENTILKDVIHISEDEKGYKQFNPTDLPKLNLIIIKELIKKVETLKNKIKEMEER